LWDERRENLSYYCKGKEQKPISLCSMPNYRADMVDGTVWNWLKGIIEKPTNITEGLRNIDAEALAVISRIIEQIEIIDQQLVDQKKSAE
jgi:hypothetical protein